MKGQSVTLRKLVNREFESFESLKFLNFDNFRVKNAFESSRLNEYLEELVKQKLDQINLEGKSRFAVRSSGVTEDSEESSAAGQNETFLGLGSNEEVFAAICKCWASLYSYQSVLYRK